LDLLRGIDPATAKESRKRAAAIALEYVERETAIAQETKRLLVQTCKVFSILRTTLSQEKIDKYRKQILAGQTPEQIAAEERADEYAKSPDRIANIARIAKREDTDTDTDTDTDADRDRDTDTVADNTQDTIEDNTQDNTEDLQDSTEDLQDSRGDSTDNTEDSIYNWQPEQQARILACLQKQ
jgi:hypothetical protein